MQIKRYEAATLQEAMMKVKNDLGPEAVVLSTNRSGRGKNAVFELTAARDRGALPPAGGKPRMPGAKGVLPETIVETPDRHDGLAGIRQDLAEMKSLLAGFQDSRLLHEEFAELKDTLEDLLSTAGYRLDGRSDGPWQKIYRRLIAGGLSRPKAWKILQAARQETGGRVEHLEGGISAAASIVKRAIRIPGAQDRMARVQVLVGPTGVGKTTTVAKLAAYYALQKRKKVALVTMDTYRIAAADQLKIYADIMGLPMAVASEKTALKKALGRFEDFDLLLVDTPGKNRSDMAYMEKLQDSLKGEEAPEKHLLLSLTSSREASLDAASRFGRFSYDSLILTKADECCNFGPLFDVIETVEKPVSFVTNGQAVPQDIEKADPEKLAGLIVRGRVH
ncbi:MAG TPA: flagellar biosynthesis protein FlhF [Syntrophales bacterium]|nr:flagellar biosynthesis protein FlhF [Syntrophales bacterium]